MSDRLGRSELFDEKGSGQWRMRRIITLNSALAQRPATANSAQLFFAALNFQ
ncbi:hypothetical protein [Nostoc sp.]|uniref:hypothetical protein n=1 Tax=Nostoc sp. TaxID=1180 RepID=UPI002FF7386B